MALPGIPIPETQCIGDSLFSINNALTALDTAVTAAAGANGTVTSVTGTAPISVATGTTTPAISISNATTSAAGAMSSTDKARLDDASGVNGIVQCNGAGDFSAASVVTKIVAGSNITISPAGGTGDVTINGAEAGASVTVNDDPPSGASPGDLWFDSSSGITSVYYDSTWIDVGGGDSGTSAGSVNGIVKSDGAGNFSAAVAGTDYAIPGSGGGNIYSNSSSLVTTAYTGNATEVLQITLQSTPTASTSLVHLSLFWDFVQSDNGYLKVYRNGNQESWRFSPEASTLDGGSSNNRVTWFDYVNTAGPHTYTVYLYGGSGGYLNSAAVTITNLGLEIATIY
jgi:hypothetical protein